MLGALRIQILEFGKWAYKNVDSGGYSRCRVRHVVKDSIAGAQNGQNRENRRPFDDTIHYYNQDRSKNQQINIDTEIPEIPHDNTLFFSEYLFTYLLIQITYQLAATH